MVNMGMFDTVRVLDKKLKCAVGHILSEFQTKSMDCTMEKHILYKGYLYGLVDTKTPEPFIDDDTKYLVVPNEDEYMVFNYSGSIDIYTSCRECDPICIEGNSTFNGNISDAYVWCEFSLTFQNGKLVDTKTIKSQTRSALKKELAISGSHVLPDTDRCVKQHLAKLRENKHQVLF